MDIQNFHQLKLLAFSLVAIVIFFLIYILINDMKKSKTTISLWKTYRILGWFLILFGFLFVILVEYLYVSGIMGRLSDPLWEEKVKLIEIIIPPSEFLLGFMFLIKSIKTYQSNREKEIRYRTWEIQKIGIIFAICLTLPMILPVLVGYLIGI